MRRHLFTLFACALLAAASISRAASVNIAIDSGQLYNSSGVALSANSLVLLIADTGNDGFGSISAGSLAIGDFLNSNDQILYRGGVTIEGGLSVALFGGTSLPLGEGMFSNLQTGNALALVWFPDLNTASYSVLTGSSYGMFTTTMPAGGSAAWSVPSATSSITLKFFTSAVGGPYPESAGNASFAAIPEPREYALMVAGLLFVVVVLRSRRVRG